MILKKITVSTLMLIFLTGCAQNTALLGPAYTLATSGNVYQAGFTYGGNEIITQTTGKTITQNIKELIDLKEEDSEFEKLVKRNIKETRIILNLSSQ